MAIHKKCSQLERGSIIFGEAFAVVTKCKMIKGDACKGSGQTRGSLHQYCCGCARYYGICEICGHQMVAECGTDSMNNQ